MREFDEMRFLRARTEVCCEQFGMDAASMDALLGPGLGASRREEETRLRIADETLTLLFELFDASARRSWFRTPNTELGGYAPLVLATLHLPGLREVRDYLRSLDRAIDGGSM